MTLSNGVWVWNADSGPIDLALVAGVSSVVLRKEVDLNTDPLKLGEDLDIASNRVRDGVPEAEGYLYWIGAATPEWTTPMQFGGYFLEREREVLDSLVGSGKPVILALTGSEPYLDFISALPATAIAVSLSETEQVEAIQMAPDKLFCIQNLDFSGQILGLFKSPTRTPSHV